MVTQADDTIPAIMHKAPETHPDAKQLKMVYQQLQAAVSTVNEAQGTHDRYKKLLGLFQMVEKLPVRCHVSWR